MYSENQVLDNEKQALYLLGTLKNMLFFVNEDNNNALMKLFVVTGFKDELVVNLSYLRGLEGKSQLTGEEKDILNDINQKELKEKEYFGKLLDSGLMSVNELYNLIVIHEQRHFFSLPESMVENVKKIIRELKNDELKQEPNLEGVNKIAIFGSTYKTQKDRLENGLSFYKSKKDDKNPDMIYLLTGHREMYPMELAQLEVISEDNLNIIIKGAKEFEINIGNNIGSLIEFLSSDAGKGYLEHFNRNKIIEVLKKLEESSSAFKDVKFDDNADTLDLLTLLTQAQEKDLFELAKHELDIPDNIVTLVFSDGISGSNIMHGSAAKNMPPRANTEDTLRTLLEKDKDFDKILFVSNGQFVPQQFISTLSVQADENEFKVGKAYGQGIQHGEQKNIAARHYGMGPVVAKLLKSRETDLKQHLSGNAVKDLKDKDSNEAYDIGKNAVATRQH